MNISIFSIKHQPSTLLAGLVFILFSLFMSESIYAQLADFKIAELAEESTSVYSGYLGLDNYKRAKLLDTYTKYYKGLSRLHTDDDYIDGFQQMSKFKSESIRQLLNKHELQVYNTLEDVRRQSQINHYIDISNAVEADRAVLQNLREYFSSSIFPLLSNAKLHFENELNQGARVLLDDKAYLFRYQLDSLISHNVPLTLDNISVLKGSFYEILGIMDMNDDLYASQMQGLSSAQKRWKQDVSDIFRKHSYTTEQMNTLLAPSQALAVLGLEQDFNILRFALLEPYNEAKYISDFKRLKILSEDLLIELITTQ